MITTITIEFCLVILLLLVIFTVNIAHILYLILCQQTKSIKSIRWILINSSLSSLIVSIWLIPIFYFRLQCSSNSILWRLWSFVFHIIDAVQVYSLFLLLTTRSCQKILIGFIWLVPLIAYSPLLWLTSPYDPLDYLPYRRLTLNVPPWILPILYFSMYLIPMISSFVMSIIHMICPLIDDSHSKEQKNIVHTNEHHQDMTELADLIERVFRFQLKPSTNKFNTLKTWISSLTKSTSKEDNQSSSCQVCQHESLVLFDQLSLSSLMHSSFIRNKTCTDQPLNSYLLFIIASLLLLVHLPYILLALFDITTLQLSTFIYIHWFGTLFIPIIHIQGNI